MLKIEYCNYLSIDLFDSEPIMKRISNHLFEQIR